mmetsp:Transcript_13264/g.37454  ORF Transcript_13264/g.37454 Transcript_13264/m.37454 type:complete len:222 (-) Transcript_13264:100-765(-)
MRSRTAAASVGRSSWASARMTRCASSTRPRSRPSRPRSLRPGRTARPAASSPSRASSTSPPRRRSSSTPPPPAWSTSSSREAMGSSSPTASPTPARPTPSRVARLTPDSSRARCRWSSIAPTPLALPAPTSPRSRSPTSRSTTSRSTTCRPLPRLPRPWRRPPRTARSRPSPPYHACASSSVRTASRSRACAPPRSPRATKAWRSSSRAASCAPPTRHSAT